VARRRRRAGEPGRLVAVTVAAGIALAALGGQHHPGAPASSTHSRAAAVAIAYAQAQLGKPYLWGGTGPGAFDCSGLVMQAYAAARITIPRTSQDQWARGPQVDAPEPGDLVFFAGSDGTVTAPGHVGLVTGPHQMIEAYATGFPIRYSRFGTPDSPPGDQAPVGYTRPWAHGGP
jgi:cell wall-associated NlpC family hydrolase